MLLKQCPTVLAVRAMSTAACDSASISQWAELEISTIVQLLDQEKKQHFLAVESRSFERQRPVVTAHVTISLLLRTPPLAHSVGPRLHGRIPSSHDISQGPAIETRSTCLRRFHPHIPCLPTDWKHTNLHYAIKRYRRNTSSTLCICNEDRGRSDEISSPFLRIRPCNQLLKLHYNTGGGCLIPTRSKQMVINQEMVQPWRDYALNIYAECIYICRAWAWDSAIMVQTPYATKGLAFTSVSVSHTNKCSLEWSEKLLLLSLAAWEYPVAGGEVWEPVGQALGEIEGWLAGWLAGEGRGDF